MSWIMYLDISSKAYVSKWLYFLATEVYLPKFLSILFVILLSNHEESQPSIFISKANIGIPTHM